MLLLMEDVRVTALENKNLNYPKKMDSTDSTSASCFSLFLLLYSLIWIEHFLGLDNFLISVALRSAALLVKLLRREPISVNCEKFMLF